jgi:hypothetical protein
MSGNRIKLKVPLQLRWICLQGEAESGHSYSGSEVAFWRLLPLPTSPFAELDKLKQDATVQKSLTCVIIILYPSITCYASAFTS